jgi:magnesium-transporting ATPase (P-type)
MTEQEPTFEEKKWARELQIEEAKWKAEKIREEAHRAHDNSLAFHTYVNQATIESANIALKTLIVINGGAAIAILTFLGGVASKDKINLANVTPVAMTIRYFAIGVGLTLAAMAFSYLTNYFMAGIERGRLKTYTHPYVADGPDTPRQRWWNRLFHILSFGCAFASLILFGIGLFVASDNIPLLLAK